MTAAVPHRVKGWCPGALRPMRTGDGLLVRLRLSGGVLTAATARAVADLAARFGNGLVDQSQRGNLQLRGVTDAGFPALIEALGALDLLDADAEAEAIRNVIVSPLAGRDPTARVDGRTILADLEARLAGEPDLRALPGKFGFLIDEGGALSLRDVAADIRLHGVTGGLVSIALGGTGDDALPAALVEPADAAETAIAHARAFLTLRTADERRMRALVARVGVEAIRNAAASLPPTRPAPAPRAGFASPATPSAGFAAPAPSPLEGEGGRRPDGGLVEPANPAASVFAKTSILTSALRAPSPSRGEGDGAGLFTSPIPSVLLLAPPLGRWEVPQLLRLADIAEAHAEAEIRLTPWRLVAIPGVRPGHEEAAKAEAVAAGLIVEATDPRLAVVACAGAPACDSAHRPARDDALALAEAAARLPGSGVRLHVSGCPKGCARPEPTAVTLVGTPGGYDLILAGTTQDRPAATGLTTEDVLARLKNLAHNGGDETGPAMTAETTPNHPPATRESYVREGAAIYERSFAIIRAEADLTRFALEEEPVAVRIIHACGMVEVAGDIAFAPGAVAAARAALKAGAPILCDAKMVAHGITRARLPADNEVVCTLDDPRVPALAKAIDNTRSAAAMELWRDRLGGALVAIGNAPTALFRLLELLDAGVAPPAAVIGMPVGFVGAAESKEALIADGRVPYLVVRGRKGGSAMTAATVNAVASERE